MKEKDVVIRELRIRVSVFFKFYLFIYLHIEDINSMLRTYKDISGGQETKKFKLYIIQNCC